MTNPDQSTSTTEFSDEQLQREDREMKFLFEVWEFGLSPGAVEDQQQNPFEV